MDRQLPALEIYSHCSRANQTTLAFLQSKGEIALPLCIESPGPGECDLLRLTTVEISLVTDGVIADVHQQFMDDPTPTDVITFQHGEILISWDTAQQAGEENDVPFEEELLLYLIHGLLHLNGHLDHEAAHRKSMHAIQDRIWTEIKDK